MATRTDAYPDVAIPPGEYLLEEIEARSINGKKAITAETALQLELAMPEIPARFWLNLETDYQLIKALVQQRTAMA